MYNIVKWIWVFNTDIPITFTINNKVKLIFNFIFITIFTNTINSSCRVTICLNSKRMGRYS